MSNNPFLPPSFSGTIPATKPGGLWNVFTGPWEDGPGIYANPPNSTSPIRYNGQDQTKSINSAQLPPPITPGKCILPGKAVGMSAIFFQS
jgi:hypothetical protein